MRLPRSVLALSLVCAMALALLPGVAHAAESPSATATAPLVQGPIDSQIWVTPDSPTTVVIVGVTLDPKVDLPARVRLPIPKGALVEWAGEILGGDATNDQQRDFTVQDGPGGGRYAEFMLSVSRRGQIDTNGVPLVVSADKVTTQVDWIQSVASTSTIFTVRLPAATSNVVIDPAPQGAPETNSAGETLYLLPVQTLATGSTTPVKIAYSVIPVGASAPGGSNPTAIYLVLGVLLVGAVAVFAYLFSRQRDSGQHDADNSGETRDSDEDESTDTAPSASERTETEDASHRDDEA